MNTVSRTRRWPWIAAMAIVGVALAVWWYFGSTRNLEAKGASRASTTLVVTTRSESRDVPVRTVTKVHIREGQNVGAGELLFSLDARDADANVKKAAAQVEKDKADLANARRNHERNTELFQQKFISQSALDTSQNQVDSLNGQLAVDSAAAESARIGRAYTEIRSTFAGRAGAISVREGSLVQPGSNSLVTITQIDPIAVAFTIPEKELPALQSALAAGKVPVSASVKDGPPAAFKGAVTFVDNSVDSTSGTIKVKAEFANTQAQLWPGMYVNVEVSPRMLRNVTVVPAQAVQTGPDSRFVYVVGNDNKVAQRTVALVYVDSGQAVVDGLDAGARIVVEGAQNLRPGSAVQEAQREGDKGGAPKGEPRKGKKAA
jgi:RND family efflux transporter MFP subunit